jgi:hypothetical protein
MLRILLDQIDKYKTGIIAIEEVRWISQGVLEKGDHAVFFSSIATFHQNGSSNENGKVI